MLGPPVCVCACVPARVCACVYLRFRQLAVAVNSVVLLSAYLAYLDPVQRIVNVVCSMAFGVLAAVIGNVVPWINLSFNRVTSLTAARTRDTFACVAALATSLASIAETDDGDDDEGRSVSQRLQQVPPLLMALMLLAM